MQKKVKKICQYDHLPVRHSLPAWPSSQFDFAGIPPPCNHEIVKFGNISNKDMKDSIFYGEAI